MLPHLIPYLWHPLHAPLDVAVPNPVLSSDPPPPTHVSHTWQSAERQILQMRDEFLPPALTSLHSLQSLPFYSQCRSDNSLFASCYLSSEHLTESLPIKKKYWPGRGSHSLTGTHGSIATITGQTNNIFSWAFRPTSSYITVPLPTAIKALRSNPMQDTVHSSHQYINI